MRRISVDLLVLLVLIVLASAYVCFQALQIFAFCDMAIFLDAGYRVWQGQKIYVDFFYIAGPVHPYLYALFFLLFGYTKMAVLAYLCVTQAIALTTIYWIARRRLGVGLSAALCVLACVSMFGPIAHPWYDLTAITFFLIASAVMLVSVPPRGTMRAWMLPAICGGLMALSFLSKSNIGLSGGAMLLLGYLLLAHKTRDYRSVVAYCAGGLAVMAALILTLASPSAYVYQNFLAFGTAKRLTDVSKFQTFFQFHPFISMEIAAAIIAILGGRRWCEDHAAEFILLMATWATGLIAAWTGSAVTTAYCFFWAPVVLYLCLLAAELPKGPPLSMENRVFKTGRIVSWISVLVLTVYALPRQLDFWSWVPDDADHNYTLRSGGFAGWHCRRDIGRGVDQIVDYINQNVSKSDSIFVFPDCAIIYGLTGHDSYRKVPWSFNIDSSGPGPLRTEMMDHFKANPPKWVVVRKEESFVTINTTILLGKLGLGEILNAKYREIPGPWFGFTLFEQNTAASQR